MAKDNFGPRPRSPRPPEGTQIPTILPNEQISFDKEAFSNLIRSQGIRMKHMRAMPDPRGQSGRNDIYRPNFTAQSNGYVYQEGGCFQAFFSASSTSTNMTPEALIEDSTAYLTMPDFYEDGTTQVLLSEWDRLYIQDIETRVVGKQEVEASATGMDRLQFPAVCVEWIMDANGVEYKENTHFKITPEGNIQWIGQQRPAFDVKIGRGVTYSIRYRYVPFYIITRMPHEIRVAQVTNQQTFDRKLERMPYQVMAVREKVFMDRTRDPVNYMSDTRFEKAPPSGGNLGPK